MMGGMLAGHDQCTGEVIEKNGKKYKLFYGMSSDTAMKKYVGGVAEYRWETYQVHNNYSSSLSMKLISVLTTKCPTLSSPLCSQGFWGEDSGGSL